MSPANVLTIEDSAPDRMLMKIALDEAGLNYILTALSDGAKALEYIRDRNARPESTVPDIILLDMNVPNSNGLEILHEIRASYRFARINVMVLSSSLSPNDQAAVRNMAYTIFETKPRDLDGYLQLGHRIRSYVQQYREDWKLGGAQSNSRPSTA